jgi:citrate lyase beta subunit
VERTSNAPHATGDEHGVWLIPPRALSILRMPPSSMTCLPLTSQELDRARAIVAAFEAVRAAGEARVELDGSLIEVPTYHTAKRLLARGEAMKQFERARD